MVIDLDIVSPEIGLDCAMTVPGGWVQTAPHARSGLFGSPATTLCLMQDKATRSSQICVEAEPLFHEVTAGDWIQSQMALRKHELLERVQVRLGKHVRPVQISMMKVAGQPFFFAASAVRRGPVLFCAVGSMPVHGNRSVKDETVLIDGVPIASSGVVRNMLSALATFAVKAPANDSPVEPASVTCLKSAPPVCFHYPGSWRVKPCPVTGTTLLEQWTLKKPGVMHATSSISVSVVRASANTDALSALNDRLKEMGGQGITRLAGTKSPGSAIKPQRAVYQSEGTSHGSKVDVRIFAMQASGVVICVERVCVSRDISPQPWAINNGAFECVSKSIVRQASLSVTS